MRLVSKKTNTKAATKAAPKAKQSAKPATKRAPRKKAASKVETPKAPLLLTYQPAPQAPLNILPTSSDIIYLPAPKAITQAKGKAKSHILKVPYLGESPAYFNSQDTQAGHKIFFSKKAVKVLNLDKESKTLTLEVPNKIIKARNLFHLAA